jgi:CRISPR-associated endonuclease/helicase Cas3
MCPKHRSQVFREIRRRLDANQTCRVVSTQLIEAGVDVDFPIVYRAICGLDSIAQAAGRCNREGKLDSGDVRVFRLPQPPPPGILRSTAETTQGLLQQFSDDLIAPEAIEAYFRMHYWRNKSLWDSRKIMEMHVDARIGHIDFADIAKEYQIIRDASLRVLIPYGKTGKRLLERVRHADPITRPLTRMERKEVDRYSISLFENLVLPAIGRDFEYAYEGQYILLLNPSLYDEKVGFDVKKIGYIDPGSLVV